MAISLFEKVCSSKELMEQLGLEKYKFTIHDFVGLEWFTVIYRLNDHPVSHRLFYRLLSKTQRFGFQCFSDFIIGRDQLYKDDDKFILVFRYENYHSNVVLLSQGSMVSDIPDEFFGISREREDFVPGSLNTLHKEYILYNIK